MDLRGLLRWSRACAFDWSGANRRARQKLDGSRAAVLLYHRVIPRPTVVRDAVEPGMYVTPQTFDRHLAWLETYFRVLPLHEIVARLRSGRSLPPGACAITFDDGWKDNHDFALPELEKRGLPATVFVVTDRVGTTGAFWPDEVCRRLASLSHAEARQRVRQLGVVPGGDPVDALLAHLKGLAEETREEILGRLRAETPGFVESGRELVDWGELDRFARAGIDVEAHGATHAILTTIAEPQARRELEEARIRLRERGHGRHGLLAYPSGAHDATVRRIARAAGYVAAFTTDRGLAQGSSDPLSLPRLGIHDDVSRSRAEFLYAVPGRS